MEAEEAGIRGDVDQAQDLMNLCEQLKEEHDGLVAQHEIREMNLANEKSNIKLSSPSRSEVGDKSPHSDADSLPSAIDKKMNAWMNDSNHITEKQMEVCEVCGAFLIVGDVQQRIEDHLMGKQHLGFSKLRKAIEEIHERRKQERERGIEESKRREERSTPRSSSSYDEERRRERDCRGRSRDRGNGHHNDRNRHHRSHHHRSRRSRSRNASHRDNRSRRNSRSRSRSRGRR